MPVYTALMPVFQKDVLGVGPDGLGLLLASPGIGAVLGGLTLASIAHRIHRKGLFMLGCLAMLGVCLALFAVSRSLPLAMLALVAVGMCQMFYMTTTNTMLQIIVPDALRGRVLSIYFLDHGLMPLGALLAGIATYFVGAPLTVAVSGGCVVLLAAVVGWRLPHFRRMVT
jgi:MFS family permease